ncbi:acetyltransferase [Colletotrichum karsti]|uniref:Acetyltransferase n=1 Tax=Colletotrichum karsti TaxID=1095194 RepID=A0A9P6LFE4_9PEZI|nr:acetyltransferase [Colletotrichum karsti]KAF9870242.1 acetyltransferase [Colletotrichum karsti]
MPQIHIRDAGLSPDDATFIVEAFDSTLPHLEAVGSGEMWGPTPFSQKDGFADETAKDVRASETYRTTGEGEALRIFVAEVELGTEAAATAAAGATPHGLRCRVAEDDGARSLAVGAAFVRERWVPDHIGKQFHVDGIRDALEGREDFVFLDVVVTDYRAGEMREGAGGALVGRAMEYGVEKGKRVLYLDAWAGNERKLVKLYEKMGFSVVAEFEMRRANGSSWPGVLMQLNLGD